MSIYDKYYVYHLEQDITSYTDDRIFIKTGEENNLLELARKNPILKEKYKQLLLNDYVLYFHKDGISRFIKRILSYEVLDENKYISDNEIFYTLQEPFGRKINEKVEKSY